MKIIQALPENFPEVKYITQTTIRTVYPHYYPAGAVQHFCGHHSDERIMKDIAAGNVFLMIDGNCAVGTVTTAGDKLNRLFVLPEYRHRGYGRALLDFAEQRILAEHGAVLISASLPAKEIYLKRGYRITDCHVVPTENGDYLCYDSMELKVN